MEIIKDMGLQDTARVQFTPNFCHISEFKQVFDETVSLAYMDVIVDGPEALLQGGPDIFAGKRVGLRIDPSDGGGHSSKVVTAGNDQKFGVPLSKAPAALSAAHEVGAKLVGTY